MKQLSYYVAPQTAGAADRMIDVCLMRHAGLSFGAIGRAYGISRKRAAQIYERAHESRYVRWRWFQRCLTLNQCARVAEDLRG